MYFHVKSTLLIFFYIFEKIYVMGNLHEKYYKNKV